MSMVFKSRYFQIPGGQFTRENFLENILENILENFLEIPYTRKMGENEQFAHVTESKFNLKTIFKKIFKNFFFFVIGLQFIRRVSPNVLNFSAVVCRACNFKVISSLLTIAAALSCTLKYGAPQLNFENKVQARQQRKYELKPEYVVYQKCTLLIHHVLDLRASKKRQEYYLP